MALSNIKKTVKLLVKHDSLINQTDENEIDKENQENNCVKNGEKNSASETKVIHNIPSSLIKATKEDKAKLKYVLIMNNLQDHKVDYI